LNLIPTFPKKYCHYPVVTKFVHHSSHPKCLKKK
jgi:hypothetical protein